MNDKQYIHYDDLVTPCGHCRMDPSCHVCHGKGYFLTITGQSIEKFFLQHIIPLVAERQAQQAIPKAK